MILEFKIAFTAMILALMFLGLNMLTHRDSLFIGQTFLNKLSAVLLVLWIVVVCLFTILGVWKS